ncbi:MAG: hypothetical protein JWP38_1911 [Herbaspirillum sp.]|jgi:chromate transporter|nr:hypothetical protein [Herbaspirillum sp.]
MGAGAVSLSEIFTVVFLSSLLSIGGGGGQTAMIQDHWVSHGLLPQSLFAWSLALGYLCPGPKSGFLAAVGYYMYGLPGAMIAMAGIIVPTCAGSAAVAYAYARLRPVIMAVALPTGFVVAGMIAAAAWDMLAPLTLNAYEIAAIVAIAVLVGWRNLEPTIVVLGSALAGVLWWRFGSGW